MNFLCGGNNSWIIILIIILLFCNNDCCNGTSNANSCGCNSGCGFCN